jgi:hypothetical protein
MSLVQRLRQRAFNIFLLNDVSPAEARKLAARELAQAQKQRQQKDVRPKSVGGNAANSGGLRAEFMRRLFDGLGRLREPPRSRPRLVSHVLDRAVAAPPAVATKAEPPSANANLIIGVYVGESTGAQLISEDEYVGSLRSPVLANWRASIEANERRARERQNRWIG